tara:strand:- start:46 stop:312 length:267 start_codon:yes stop_codon:yes gene_type:complete
MMLNIIFVILLLILIFNLKLKETFTTQEDLEKLYQKLLFNQKIRLLRDESIRNLKEAKDKQTFNYLNEDNTDPYLTEYKCLDYEDIKI